MDMLEERPPQVTEILTSMRFWNKSHSQMFLKEFVLSNCDKINFVLDNNKIEETIENMDESKIKSQIIHLLQSITKNDKVIFPKAYR